MTLFKRIKLVVDALDGLTETLVFYLFIFV